MKQLHHIWGTSSRHATTSYKGVMVSFFCNAIAAAIILMAMHTSFVFNTVHATDLLLDEFKGWWIHILKAICTERLFKGVLHLLPKKLKN